MDYSAAGATVSSTPSPRRTHRRWMNLLNESFSWMDSNDPPLYLFVRKHSSEYNLFDRDHSYSGDGGGPDNRPPLFLWLAHIVLVILEILHNQTKKQRPEHASVGHMRCLSTRWKTPEAKMQDVRDPEQLTCPCTASSLASCSEEKLSYSSSE